MGAGCTIGHGAIVHGCTIGDNVLIGMGATVLNGARIGDDCIVGAGALVTGKMDAPAGSMILGSPAIRIESELEIRKGLRRLPRLFQRVAALEAECARLVALGATRVRLLEADEENESCLVMQDVEGNEFCLD